jgi:two-component system, response regulator, stage 0 sporulation protein F
MRVFATMLRDAGLPLRRRPLVVVGEDDQDIRDVLVTVLGDDGYEVQEAADGGELVELLIQGNALDHAPDAVVMDVCMPVYSGLEVLEKLRRAGREVPVILVTAFGRDIEPLAQRLGARAVFQKPFDLDDLRTAVAYVVEPHPTRASGGGADAPSR